MLKRITLWLVTIVVVLGLNGCAANGVRITDGSSIANGALGGVAVFKVLAVAQVAKNYYETGDGSQGAIDHAENSKEYTEKKEKEWKKKATIYEEKLNKCIKSHNVTDFDATSGAQWNREDIKDQLKDCHLRIKNGEDDF